MKKILVLNYEFPPLGGGASPVSYEIAKRLSETGDFDIDVVTMKYQSLASYEEVNPHFRIHRVKCLRSKKEICHPWEQLTYLFSAWFKCKELLKKNTYDICHTHFIIPTGVLALRLKKKFGLDYVITSHGSDVPGFNTDRFQLLHKFTGPFLRKISQESKNIISPSKYLKDLILLNISKNLDDKIIVIPNGIDTNKFIPQEKKKYIFSSGRLLARKGFQYLIRAVSDEDIGYEVHIAGDGPMMSELKNLAEKSKTKIVFHGWLDNNGQEYKNLVEQSAIFVLASESESFGMVIAEAMSAGCAIITTNTSGCAEVAKGSGLFINMKDSLDLKLKLTSLISNFKVLNKYQETSFIQSKRYDWSVVLKQNREVLEAIVPKRKKVLLLGSYHGNNKGDETIFLTFLKEIEKLQGKGYLTIGTKNPEYFKKNYSVNAITPVQALFSIFKYDVIILGGGGLIFDYNLLDTLQIVKKTQLLYWLGISYIGKLFYKKVMWVALGVGPIGTSFAKKVIPFVANKLDYISVRDTESYLLMKDLGVTHLEETRDIVFGMEKDLISIVDQEQSQENDSVLIIPRIWEDKADELYTLFCNGIEQLLRFGKKVVLTETNNIKDKILNEKIATYFQNNTSFRYVPLPAHSTVKDFLVLIRGSRYLISMRMHPIIIASLYDIPSIAIEYKTPKIYSVMKNLYSEDLCVSLDMFTVLYLENMEKTYDLRKKNVHEGCSEMKKLNGKNIQALQKFLVEYE